MRLAVVTGTRAEYGIFRPLLRSYEARGWPFELYVTGTHLSPQHGLTVGEIEADGFAISARVDIGLTDDTPEAVTHAMGRAVAGFGALLADRQPDLLFILGDRFEALAIAAAAQIAGVAIAHLHGGETTEGAIDEAFRHSITKMSHLHFTATETYRLRVIQLGEAPETVFAVGALGLDNLREVDPVGRSVLETELGFRFRQRNLLVTHHPLTVDLERSERDFAALLDALRRFPDAGIILTSPNADPGGRIIGGMIEAFRAEQPERVKVVTSLGTRRYFSVLRQVDAVVGNSSSGLIEVPSFGIPTVNVGERQQGRLAGPSVLSAPGDASAIQDAIERALSPEFRQALAGLPNPYGDGDTAERICAVLETLRPPINRQKRFHDLS